VVVYRGRLLKRPGAFAATQGGKRPGCLELTREPRKKEKKGKVVKTRKFERGEMRFNLFEFLEGRGKTAAVGLVSAPKLNKGKSFCRERL